jgi:hypothetical protein
LRWIRRELGPVPVSAPFACASAPRADGSSSHVSPGHLSERQAVAIRIQKCHVLAGRDSAGVRRVIGPPDHSLSATASDPEEWEWFTGTSHVRFDKSTSLGVQFDRGGHVSRVSTGV